MVQLLNKLLIILLILPEILLNDLGFCIFVISFLVKIIYIIVPIKIIKFAKIIYFFIIIFVY